MVPSQAPPRPKAYSYIRMSTERQLKGDSLRRQLEGSARYASEHQLDLQDDARLQDIGISAFDGANLETGALGKFRDAVRKGLIETGSYLLVEGFDRLSRQPPMIALQLCIEIMNAGVVLVTTSDGQVYTAATINLQQLIVSIVIMSRAHEESATKSGRIKASWQNKRDKAREAKIKGHLPGWLKFSADKKSIEVIEDRAEIVRQIFADTVAGIGGYVISRRLNAEGKKPFGNAAGWQTSTVHKIVTWPAVMGTYQPNRIEKGKAVPAGPPIEDYFPAVISRETFFSAQASRLGRRVGGGGRKGEHVTNLFSKITRCEYCDSPMHYENKGSGPKGGRYLVCHASIRALGCGVDTRWRYDDFETSFLAFVEELDLGSLFTNTVGAQARASADASIKSLEGEEMVHVQEREKAYELVNQFGMATKFIAEKIAVCESKLELVARKLVAARIELAELISIERTLYESGSEIGVLIDQVRNKKGEDIYKSRSQIALRLKSLITKIQVASAGIVPDYENCVEWSKLNGHAIDKTVEPFERKRFFRVVFRNGTSRMVYSALMPL
jgi:DNA invertase Pin-like site-specific DNA recombinase